MASTRTIIQRGELAPIMLGNIQGGRILNIKRTIDQAPSQRIRTLIQSRHITLTTTTPTSIECKLEKHGAQRICRQVQGRERHTKARKWLKRRICEIRPELVARYSSSACSWLFCGLAELCEQVLGRRIPRRKIVQHSLLRKTSTERRTKTLRQGRRTEEHDIQDWKKTL